MATFLGHCIFSWGEGPYELFRAHMPCIPKANDLPKTSANLRSIIILSASYRCFSSCIFHQLLEWHDKWCPPTICGGRPGRDALSVAMELCLSFEEAMRLGSRGLILVTLDLSKFFDSIEWDHLRGLSLERLAWLRPSCPS